MSEQIKLQLHVGPAATGKQKDQDGNRRLFAFRMADGNRLEVLGDKTVIVTLEKGGIDHQTILGLESQDFLTVTQPGEKPKEKPADKAA